MRCLSLSNIILVLFKRSHRSIKERTRPQTVPNIKIHRDSHSAVTTLRDLTNTIFERLQVRDASQKHVHSVQTCPSLLKFSVATSSNTTSRGLLSSRGDLSEAALIMFSRKDCSYELRGISKTSSVVVYVSITQIGYDIAIYS